jgi:hypothetical protein
MEVPEYAHKNLEEHRRVVEESKKETEEKELQEFLKFFKKERQGVVTQIKQVVPPFIDNKTEVTPNVSTSPPSVTYEIVSVMFVDYGKKVCNARFKVW